MSDSRKATDNVAENAGEVTKLLLSWNDGDGNALEALMPLLYNELRLMAERSLRRERPGHTLAPTALVHEAYLRLVVQEEIDWQNRAHFLGLAGRTMRRILIEHARRRQAAKRDAGVRMTLDEGVAAADERLVDILALDEALSRLAELDPRQAKLVELRYFAGLKIEEVAEVLEASPRTIKREWTLARTWLKRELLRSDER